MSFLFCDPFLDHKKEEDTTLRQNTPRSTTKTTDKQILPTISLFGVLTADLFFLSSAFFCVLCIDYIYMQMDTKCAIFVLLFMICLLLVGKKNNNQIKREHSMRAEKHKSRIHIYTYANTPNTLFLFLLSLRLSQPFPGFLTRTSPKRERKQIHFFLFLFPFSFLSGPFWLERIGFHF